jgi:TolB-like protein/Tfp pilus assembly protein PilF/tRNA A-37 threonylcarbamoyl transferase component Bud32
MVGQTLGHYRVLEKVGAGGMGVVYRARDEQLERDVALKVLPSGTLGDDSARRNFRREALALAKLNHPNIETVYEFGSQEGTDFLVMEYVPGSTLAQKLSRGPLPEKEIVALGMQIAAALEEAHERGIVHRDLKPANIAITARGQAKVLDFGLAKLLHPDQELTTDYLTESHAVPGTLPYMAPEQLRAERIEARADIYTAGVVLYEMATNRKPFAGDLPSQVIDAILHEPPLPPRALNPRISAELERIILKCMDKEPEQRYQSAKELSVDLRRLASPRSIAAPRARSFWKRAKTPAILGIIALIVLAATLTAFNFAGVRDRLIRGSAPPKITSLAVLPLENLSHDPDQEYFADGMTEALITGAAKIKSLRVTSRTSTMRYKGTKIPLRQIARELNVDAVVTGSVARSGDRVRISAQLIDPRNDRNLWAESYQSDLTDILSLQANVATAIAGEIRVQLTPEERAGLSNAAPVKPEAYEAYLHGLYSLNKRTPVELHKAIDFFQKAVELDPKYARAYAGLAEGYTLMTIYGEVVPKVAMPQAKAAAQRALAIDDGLAEAHAVLADVEWSYDWDAKSADASFQRALVIDPSYATAQQWYALYLSNLGKSDDAIEHIHSAEALDPLSLIIKVNVGWCYYVARRYDQAIELLQKIEETDPDFWAAYSILGQTYLAKGDLPSAIKQLEKSRALSPETTRNVALLGNAYARAGRSAESRELLQELTLRARKRYVSPAYMAIVCTGLGERDRTFAWLDRAYDDRSDWLTLLRTDPVFDPLRSEPRFRDLIRKAHLGV